MALEVARNINIPNPNHKYSRAANKKIKSKKQSRRHENLCYLLSLLDEDDLDFDENIDFNIDLSASLFSRIFIPMSNLEVWNDFVSLSGEQQDDFIEHFDKCSKLLREKKAKNRQTIYETIDAAELNFNKIDKSIRLVLKREISREYVKRLELPIIENFQEKRDTQQVIYDVSCPFERMILHGICQYHSFKSKSMVDLDRVKFVILCRDNLFENNLHLHAFLEKNFNH